MTPAQQRIAIAEACGWKRYNAEGTDAFNPNDQADPPFPNYLSDLNAMHEAEKTLDAGQWDDYQQQLREQVRGKGAHPRDISSSHATAAQRAEAFLRTLNLWTTT